MCLNLQYFCLKLLRLSSEVPWPTHPYYKLTTLRNAPNAKSRNPKCALNPLCGPSDPAPHLREVALEFAAGGAALGLAAEADAGAVAGNRQGVAVVLPVLIAPLVWHLPTG